VRNWESGFTPIYTALELLWEVWEPRFRQEDPEFGPLTLIYTDGPMFIDPQGPRPLVTMQREPFLTNAAALARACALWGSDRFNGPLILQPSGDILWNSVELARVVNGLDTGAPTVPNMARAIAAHGRSNSAVYRRSRARLPKAEDVSRRQQEISAKADELDALAAADTSTDTNSLPFEEACTRLQALGYWPPDHLVSGLAAAFQARRIT
jgi:hypothetical protein